MGKAWTMKTEPLLTKKESQRIPADPEDPKSYESRQKPTAG